MSDNYNDNNDYEEVCMVCRRSENTAGKMIKMPGNITVCQDCMNRTMDMASKINYNDIVNMTNFMNPNMQSDNREDKDNTKAPVDDFTNIFKEMFGDYKEVNTDISTDNKDSGANVANNSANSSSELSGIVDSEDKKDDKKSNNGENNEQKGVPRFSFMNINDLMGEGLFGGNKAKVKRRKKGEPRKPLIEMKDIPAPHKIKEQLDQYVVGQEHAKKVMSVAVYNHYKRVASGAEADDIEIEKSNMLMIGPTGSGKTYLVKTLAKMLNVPLAIADATSLTEAGYIGDDIESVVSKLLAAADNDVDKAEQGIIYIDEIDKIAKKPDSKSRDVNGESVQQGMLKLLEGAEIDVPVGAASKNVMVPTATINTKDILFIVGGAFPDLEEIIKTRLSKQSSIGFNAELKSEFDKDENILQKATVEDLRKFGFIPEFIGRLPMFFTLENLTKDMLVSILSEPKNAIIKQYQKLLMLDEVDLRFTDEALVAIAEKAMEKKTGARALRSVIDEFMLDIMYEVPKDDNIGTVTITKEYIEGTGAPIIGVRG